MTPKEKAKELVNKFSFASIYFTDGEEEAKLNGKFCAELCVDEIMNGNFADGYDHSFWQEVKSEIEKL